jgi:NAD(P)-dependent dehydrogenase (short-subunit alcohol dehydrogenase family)
MRDSSLFRLDGKNVALVGAGSGIGAEVARGCARQGARVFCFDLNAEAAGAVAQQIRDEQGEAEAAGLDLLDPSALTEAFSSVRDRYKRLDIMISTPAVNVRKPLLDYTVEDFDRVVSVNLKGSFYGLQAAGRIMVEQGGGSIVLFSSIRAQVVEPGQGVYAATKAGIVQMVRALAAELGESGVRVNAIAPGVVDTSFTRAIKSNPEWYQAYASKSPFNRWARADEMVGPTVFLASDAASFVTGTVLFVDGGWTAVDGRFKPPGM